MIEGNLDLFKPAEISVGNVNVNMDFEDYYSLKSLQNRVLKYNTDIDEGPVAAFVDTVIKINLHDKGLAKEDRIPIKLFMSSDGGDVMAGFAMIDVIQNSETPIIIINTSHQYSMAAIIGLVGHKRYATPNSSFLLPDGSRYIGDSTGKLHDFLKFDAQIGERIKKIVLNNSKISAKTYNKRAREEWYFFADEAKSLGMIDGIIGEDVTLEEII